MVGDGFTVSVDEKGDTYIYPQGDTSVPPSAKMPAGGYYFDNINRQEEIDGDKLDGRQDFSEHYKIFSDQYLNYFQQTVDNLYRNTQYAIITNVGGVALGDATHLPGPSTLSTLKI